ncbi:tetratricopeptide repeat protein [Kitasatospora sp. NPDC001159]
MGDDRHPGLPQAAAVHRKLGAHHNEAVALNNLGLTLHDMQRFEEAIDAHTRAIAVFHELGDH